MKFTFEYFKNPKEAKALEVAYQQYKNATTEAEKRQAEEKLVKLITTYCEGISWNRKFIQEKEDFTQDVLLKVFSKIQTFEGKCPFSVWVGRIIEHLGNDLIAGLVKKRKRTAAPVEEGDEEDFSIDPSSLSVEDQLIARIDKTRLLDKLEPEQRELLELRVVDHESFRVIGEKLGMEEAAARQTFFRLVKKLRGAA